MDHWLRHPTPDLSGNVRQVGGDPVGHIQFAAPRYVATLSLGYSGAYTLKLSNSGLSLPVRRICTWET